MSSIARLIWFACHLDGRGRTPGMGCYGYIIVPVASVFRKIDTERAMRQLV